MRLEEHSTNIDLAVGSKAPAAAVKLPNDTREYQLWQRENDSPDATYIDLFGSFVDSNIPAADLYEPHKTLSKSVQLARQHHQHGLKEFRAGYWPEAIAEFNKCLQYIDDTADDRIAAVYLHRSKCFQALGLYEKAAADLKLAEQRSAAQATATAIDELRTKHRGEQRANSKAPSGSGLNGGDLVPVSEGSAYTGLANSVTVGKDSRFGRQLLAQKDIGVGQPLVNERVLFFASANTESRCSHCFKWQQNFIACVRCAGAMFCGRRCYQQDRVHRLTCQSRFAAVRLQLKLQVHSILMAVSMFHSVDDLRRWIEVISMENGEKLPTHVTDARSKYHFYLKLARRTELTDDLRYIGCCIYKCLLDIPKMAELFDTVQKRRFLQHLISLHFQLNATNGFSDGQSRWITVITSMLNHSCTPNVLWANNSDRSVCIAIRPIRCGEQLFISYIGNVEQTKHERQQQLFDYWQFWCRCDRCEPNGTTAVHMDLLSDMDFRSIERYRLRGFADDANRVALKERCARCLTRYGSDKWSIELSIVISLYTTILLHEMFA